MDMTDSSPSEGPFPVILPTDGVGALVPGRRDRGRPVRPDPRAGGRAGVPPPVRGRPGVVGGAPVRRGDARDPRGDPAVRPPLAQPVPDRGGRGPVRRGLRRHRALQPVAGRPGGRPAGSVAGAGRGRRGPRRARGVRVAVGGRRHALRGRPRRHGRVPLHPARRLPCAGVVGGHLPQWRRSCPRRRPFSVRTRRSRARAGPASRNCAVVRNYWIEEPTALNLLEAFLPSRVTATMQTTAMRATRRAYSTRLAPRSSLPKRTRMYGAMVPWK